LYIIY